MLALYHSGLTTCSKQVRHCLREKGLSYESRYVELLRFEHLNPAYLKLNRNGVVPTLIHDGKVLTNSFCINEYIEEAFPEPRLSPTDLMERARMRYWAWTADESHLQGARLTHNNMLKRLVDELGPDDKALVLEHMPVPERRERWGRLIRGGYTPAEVQAAIDHLLFVAQHMDEELAEHGPWLAGGTFSLGDISMLSIVYRIFELYPEALPRQRFPHVNDWYERIMARPAAKLVYTDGLEETPPRPPKRSVAGITAAHIGAAGA